MKRLEDAGVLQLLRPSDNVAACDDALDTATEALEPPLEETSYRVYHWGGGMHLFPEDMALPNSPFIPPPLPIRLEQSKPAQTVDPTPLPLTILSVNREGRLAGRVIRMTTILGQVRQGLQLDRPGPRDPAAQQAVLAVITLDIQDPCPIVHDLRHRASIHPDLRGLEPDPPCPVVRVALKAALRPDRLPLSPSRHPLYSPRTLSGPIVTLYQVGSSHVS
ncbi:hypothetical protein C6341_g26920 [Phytophthora cactorum]|nr:hypothetical protein C6341_g26920 [Phytophthora cactorum]